MKPIKHTLLIILFLSIISGIQAQTLHAIIFADTDDARVGESVWLDYYAMTGELAIIATANNMNIKEYYFNEEKCNTKNALRVLNSLKCNSDDIVFFYYSGHGARSFGDKSKFPQLILSRPESQFVPLYKINDIIKSKNPKFSVVMADCCNSFSARVTTKDLPSGKTVIKGSAEDTYQSLFGKLKGNIVVASSKAGETSIATEKGGAFTIVFLNELQKIVSGNSPANWNDLLSDTKKGTVRLVNHTPVFDIKLGGTTTAPPATNNPIQTNNQFIASLIKVSDDNADEMQRINLVQPTISEYFVSPNSKVEIYGRNGKTLLERETAEEFLERLCTSYKLVNFSEISSQKNNSGKIMSIKIREIYR